MGDVELRTLHRWFSVTGVSPRQTGSFWALLLQSEHRQPVGHYEIPGILIRSELLPTDATIRGHQTHHAAEILLSNRVAVPADVKGHAVTGAFRS